MLDVLLLVFQAQGNQPSVWTLASRIHAARTQARVFPERDVFALVIRNTSAIRTAAADRSVPTTKTVRTKRPVSGTSVSTRAPVFAVKMQSAELSTTTLSALASRTT